jgi:superfamily II DNA or RNA helicase
MPVSFTLEEKQRITSHCPCYANQKLGQICSHIVAIAFTLVLQESEYMETESTSNQKAFDYEETDDENYESDFIEIPIKPSIYAQLEGSQASLSITIDAYYGKNFEIDFPACSPQSPKVVYIPDPDDDSVRFVRSIPHERDAIKLIENYGFSPGYNEGDMKLYLIEPQKILTFLATGVPHLRRLGWTIEFGQKIEKLTDKMPRVLPVIQLRDAPNGMLDVRYSFEVDGKEINPAEVQAALNRGDGCILHHDSLPILIDIEAVEAMHDIFQDCAATQNGAPPGWFRVKSVYSSYVAESLDSLSDVICVDADNAPKWSELSETVLSGEKKCEEVSLGELETTLRPYQKTGVYWMRHLENNGHHGLLADEMGLGKTLQTLTWLALPHGKTKLPCLVVAPTSLVKNWEAEAKKFTPWQKTLVISGHDRHTLFRHIKSADIVITSYALLQRDFEDAYADIEFAAMVLDEAQHIKNRKTKNAVYAKMINARQRLALTGTPVENSVSDVWSVFEFLMPGYLSDYETFKMRYEDPVSEGGTGSELALEKLKRKLNPFILRRVKKTVAKDLPDKIIKISLCPLSEKAESEYVKALSQTRSEANSAIREKGFAKAKFQLLAMLMKLRQIASRGKYDAFKEQLMSAIEGGHRILVFSQFVKTLKMIADDFKESGIQFCYLDGSTKDRLGECEKFNKTRSIPVFLISLMAGGTGLNLTGADMVIHYDPWWNPAVEDQATDRAHRIGQKKNVYVIKMIATDTIEEKVLTLQKKKQAVISATIGASDAAVMDTLTIDDFKSLLA